MRIRTERVGRTSSHPFQAPADVTAFHLDAGPRLRVTVWTLGAALQSVEVPDHEGRVDNVTAGSTSMAHTTSLDEARYFGATLGRYARCIRDARLCLDGSEYRLDANAPPHHVHGGTYGFDSLVWQADAECIDGSLVLRLHLDRPDGDQGYPGSVAATTTYTAFPDGRLCFEHTATTTAPTVIDMTNHAYWNLAGGKCGSVDGHLLRINADRVLLVGEDLMPVGMPRTVGGTAFDFRIPRLLAGVALDNCFMVEPGEVAVLSDPVSGRRMSIATDQPGLQVYTGDALADPRAGICLQTGSWPDAPSRPEFPSARLDPGATYVHRTTHAFTANRPKDAA